MREPHQDEQGDWVCQHGTAMDVHCCGCHSGFLFDIQNCTCGTPDTDFRMPRTLKKYMGSNRPPEHTRAASRKRRRICRFFRKPRKGEGGRCLIPPRPRAGPPLSGSPNWLND
jgi:hypothetical protein